MTVPKRIKDSLYHELSTTQRDALQQLAVILEGIGFDVRKKSPHEHTLRVYPRGFRTYPLLNPRFRKSASELSSRFRRPTLEISAWTRRGPGAWANRLASFTSSAECNFIADEQARVGDDYYRLGWFLVPLTFLGDLRDQQVAFERLAQPLSQIRQFFNS